MKSKSYFEDAYDIPSKIPIDDFFQSCQKNMEAWADNRQFLPSSIHFDIKRGVKQKKKTLSRLKQDHISISFVLVFVDFETCQPRLGQVKGIVITSTLLRATRNKSPIGVQASFQKDERAFQVSGYVYLCSTDTNTKHLLEVCDGAGFLLYVLETYDHTSAKELGLISESGRQSLSYPAFDGSETHE